MKVSSVALVIFTATFLFACHPGQNADRFQSAQNLFKEQKFNEAIIELKNAISDEPSRIELRVLLAKSYFESGNLISAEKELLASLNLEANQVDIYPLLAEVLFFKTDFEQVTELELLDVHSSENSTSIAMLNCYKGVAASFLGDVENAKIYWEKASLSGQNRYSALSMILKEKSSSQFSSSYHDQIKEYASSHSDFPLIHLYNGKYELESGKLAESLSSLSEFLRLRPKNLMGTLLFSLVNLQLGNYQVANTYAKEVLKTNELQPLANQVSGASSFSLQSYDAALMHSELAINSGLDNKQNRTVAGLSAFNLKKFEIAYNHFLRIKPNLSKNSKVWQAIMATEIEIGKVDEVIKSIEFVDNEILTPSIITASGLALFQSGKFEENKKLFEKAKDVSFDDHKQLAQFASIKIATEDYSGIDDLDKSIELQPEAVYLRIAKGAALLKAGQLDDAVIFTKELLRLFPDNLEVTNFAALVARKSGDHESARRYLQHALSIDPNNPLSLMEQVSLHIEQKKMVDAENVVLNIIDKNPDYLPAYQALINLSKESGHWKLTTDLLHNAKENSNSPIVKLLIVRTLYEQKLYRETLDELEKYKVELENLDPYWLYRSNAESLIFGVKKSTNTLVEWTKRFPNNPTSWSTLITFLEDHQLSSQAYEASERAYRLFPNSNYFALAYAYYLSIDEKNNRAIEILEQVNRGGYQNKVLEHLISTHILINQKKYNLALKKVTEAYKIKPFFIAARLKFALIKGTTNNNDHFIFAEQHLSKVPSDLKFRMLLSNEYLDNQPEKAIEHYKIVLSYDSGNLIALNNVAYLLSQVKKHEEAIKYGNLALALAPNNVSILETISSVYYNAGNNKKALEFINKAIEIEPNNKDLAMKLETYSG